jgi:hypothetical protein
MEIGLSDRGDAILLYHGSHHGSHHGSSPVGDIDEASENFRKSYLVPVLNARLIEMTVLDKHNSRMQKYRLTAAEKQCPISS